MGFEKRKAHIEFIAHDAVTITNMFFQKTIYLKNECVVDLFNLKKKDVNNLDEYSVQSGIDSPFFVCFFNHIHDDDTCNEYDQFDKNTCVGNHWYGMVILKPNEEELETLDSHEDLVSLKNNKKVYNGAVWVNE